MKSNSWGGGAHRREFANANERAVVVTLTEKAAGEAPATLNMAGEGKQVTSDGAPLHAKFTDPVKPASGVTWRL